MTFDRVATHTASVNVATSNSISGGTGNDLLTGGGANGSLVGVDPSSATPGNGEIDTLINSGTRDRFILGNTDRVYDNDGNSTNNGLNDYAKIAGFSVAAGDVIQLQGAAGDYALSPTPAGVAAGTAIYNNLLGEPELIGIIENGSELSLTDPYFTYV